MGCWRMRDEQCTQARDRQRRERRRFCAAADGAALPNLQSAGVTAFGVCVCTLNDMDGCTVRGLAAEGGLPFSIYAA
jgi:hypothetical protein